MKWLCYDSIVFNITLFYPSIGVHIFKEKRHICVRELTASLTINVECAENIIAKKGEKK